MTENEMIKTIEHALRYVKPSRDEVVLQNRMAKAFETLDIKCRREFNVGTGIVDFLAFNRIAIEVKTAGSMARALAQLGRYLKSDKTTAGILVTTKGWRQEKSDNIHGKEVHIMKIWRSGL